MAAAGACQAGAANECSATPFPAPGTQMLREPSARPDLRPLHPEQTSAKNVISDVLLMRRGLPSVALHDSPALQSTPTSCSLCSRWRAATGTLDRQASAIMPACAVAQIRQLVVRRAAKDSCGSRGRAVTRRSFVAPSRILVGASNRTRNGVDAAGRGVAVAAR